jgi:hypothetical protein
METTTPPHHFRRTRSLCRCAWTSQWEQQQRKQAQSFPFFAQHAHCVVMCAVCVPSRLSSISSRNAYMVVYTVRGRRSPASLPRRELLTAEMEAQVVESDARLQERIVEYAARKNKLEQLIEQRKAKAQQVWDLAPALPVPIIDRPHDIFSLPTLDPDFKRQLLPGLKKDTVQFDTARDSIVDDVYLAQGMVLGPATG